MAEPATKAANYEDLYRIPENMTGQIIDGELIVTPRPSRSHALAATMVAAEIAPRYSMEGRGGPGGWIILIEPEIKLDKDVLVPDLAGWRKERFPWPEETNWISASPDWVCEILSPATVLVDRIKKMNIYAREKVPYFWVIDPRDRTLEALKLVEPGQWVVLGVYGADDKVRAEPFPDVEIDLSQLWLERQLGSKEAGPDR